MSTTDEIELQVITQPGPPDNEQSDEEAENSDASSNAAEQSSPPSTPHSDTSSHQDPKTCSLFGPIRKACTASRLSIAIGMFGLMAGAIYYYGPYMVAKKSLAIEIWKDCRDRAVSVYTLKIF
jgi:hypothetical protein